jgi:hypothetical protein
MALFTCWQWTVASLQQLSLSLDILGAFVVVLSEKLVEQR